MFKLKVAAKKFLIYGTGLFGKWYCENMDGAIGFVDSNKKEDSIYNLPVYNVDEIKNVDYDEVHVANAHIETLFNLFEQGVSKDKIVIANPKVYEVYSHERGGMWMSQPIC